VRVTGIGGGHGLAETLRAALRYADDVSAVVTVADDGGSSGRLVRELGVPPPGDIRNCLVALAEPSDLTDLYQHRFERGELTGHALGNLIIAALTEKEGDFGRAVEQAGELLGARGRVFPATTETVGMRALVDGNVVHGQVAVATTGGFIQAVFLDPPEPDAYSPAVEAVMSADQVVLGPGSLFTSLIATLMVPGIRQALQDTRAQRVLIANNRVQKGETSGLDVTAHIEAVLAHAGADCLDSVVVQSPVLDRDGVPYVGESIEALGLEVVEADVSTSLGGHDPVRLAAALVTASPRGTSKDTH
jgi:uncharacterized cofD-like protein